MKLKLGLDIGIASVGYGVIDENNNILESGVRLFSEGTAENNRQRRALRGSRRLIRRRHHRLERMQKFLKESLNIPTPTFLQNVYEIRVKGLTERLTKDELFSTIMHLTKRRGTHFLTAEDFEEQDGEKSTEEILKIQEKSLAKKFVAEIQYETFFKTHKVRGIENRFRNKDYLKELTTLLNTQKKYHIFLTEDAINKILSIYSSKREYFDGPGDKNSPSPYGSYRLDKNGNIVKVNLIDLMRGVCTYFNGKNGLPVEKRIAKNSYTACAFNLLNDLNNMKVDNRSITEDEKLAIFRDYINYGVNITLDRIKKVTGVSKELMKGYRVDKHKKPVITTFDGFIAIKKVFDANQICLFNETYNEKDSIKIIDTIADILTKEKSVDTRKESLVKFLLSMFSIFKPSIIETISDELKKLGRFTQYHSLSKKAMDLILDDLFKTNKNQMQLFTIAGLTTQTNQSLIGTTLKANTSDWVVSPVTLRAVNESVKVFNAIRKLVLKKYKCEFSDVVVELAREKNSEDRKIFINQMQKNNEKIHKEISTEFNIKTLTGQQYQVIKLLKEQNWICPYSGENITLAYVKNNMMEIDHIIPLSLSFDDSQSNKLAVLGTENQNKGQNTPAGYLKSGKGKISYEQFKKTVLENKNYSKKKRENLCYEGDLSKDAREFIGRNLSDTRYASRKVFNLLQGFFKANNLPTKVKVINGSFTNMFRKKAKLDKDRENTFAHHAQDALIVAGLSNLHLMKALNNILEKDPTVLNNQEDLVFENGKLINKTTGEIITIDDFKAPSYIQFIKNIANCSPRYSFKVDKKPNRDFYNQQIKSTRTIKNKKGIEEDFVVCRYKDIYQVSFNNKDGANLAKRIKEKPESLLMYHNDNKSFEKLKQIVNDYPESANPFADYYKEHGWIVKDARKGREKPIIKSVKYISKKVGSHRPNNKQQGNVKSIFLSIKSYRIDLYKSKDKFSFVNVTYDMLKQKNNVYVVNNEKYTKALATKGINDDFKFCFSLYSGDQFSYTKNNQKNTVIYSCVNSDADNKIEFKYLDKPSIATTQSQRIISINSKISDIKKQSVDVLGFFF